MHEVLVNRLGGLSLPRKSVVRLTDRPDMTLDVYRGRKTTMQCNRYFVHKVVPIQNACVRKRGVTQPKIYGIGSKVNQFIYTLVCNYMPNIRILAKAVLKIICSQGCFCIKCLSPKKGNNSTKNLRNKFKS